MRNVKCRLKVLLVNRRKVFLSYVQSSPIACQCDVLSSKNSLVIIKLSSSYLPIKRKKKTLITV